MNAMTTAPSPGPAQRGPGPAQHWPDCVPVIEDTTTGVRLRPHREEDLPAIVEQCNDPATQRWTTVPVPEGGYSLSEARDFALGIIPRGWQDGTLAAWAIDAEVDGVRGYCGAIDLRFPPERGCDVGFVLHPRARGRGIMTAALRLAVDHAFDVAGQQVVHWYANVGNWASRRVAAAAGFRFEGTLRRFLDHRGTLVDAWAASITADDSRTPQPWPLTPVLAGEGLRLRPVTETDLPRVAEACADPRTRHWLVSLPTDYDLADATDWWDSVRTRQAAGHQVTWGVADGDDTLLAQVSLAGLDGYAPRAEIGYWTHPDARGRGVMTAAVRMITAWATQSGTARNLLIRCAAGNRASRRVAVTAGYTEAGRWPDAEPLGDDTFDDLVSYVFHG